MLSASTNTKGFCRMFFFFLGGGGDEKFKFHLIEIRSYKAIGLIEVESSSIQTNILSML